MNIDPWSERSSGGRETMPAGAPTGHLREHLFDGSLLF